RFTAIAAAGLVIAAAAAAMGGVPATLTHQGRLFDATGKPVNSNVTILFNIYAAEADSMPVFSEVIDVAVEDGYFSASLGEINSLKSVFDGQIKYLGLTVGNDPEMTPRAIIRSVPYAMVAGDAIGDIHPTSVTINGTKIIDETGKWIGDTAGLQGPPG